MYRRDNSQEKIAQMEVNSLINFGCNPVNARFVVNCISGLLPDNRQGTRKLRIHRRTAIILEG